MDHLLCKVISALNPGQYLIQSQEEKHCLEVKHLEELLTKEINCRDTKPNDEFYENMNVIVKLPISVPSFKRGVINKETRKDFYEVFLIDSGRVVTLNKSNIWPGTDAVFNELEPLVYKVTLHGILPVEFVDKNDRKMQMVSENWSEESKSFIDALLKTMNSISLECILVHNNKVYGDLHISNVSGEVISLRHALVKKEFCIYSEKYFVRKVVLNNGVLMKVKNNLSEFSRNKNTDCPEKEIPLITKYESNIADNYKLDPTLKLRNIQIKKAFKHLACDTGNNIDDKKFVETATSSVEQVNVNQTSNCAKDVSPKTKSWQRGEKLFTSGPDAFDSSQKSKEDVSDRGSTPACEGNTGDQADRVSHRDNDQDKNDILESFFMANNPLLRTVQNNVSSDIFNKERQSAREEVDRDVITDNLQVVNDYYDPFVLFKDSVLTQIKRFKDLPIHADVIQNLQKCGSFDYLSPLQRWAIPAICSGTDLLLLGNEKTGKTLAYLLPLVDFVRKKCLEKPPSGNGPIAVIVCSSSRACEFAFSMCNILVGRSKGFSYNDIDISIVLAYGGHEKEVMVNLTNGCHILISTPHCLVRLLQNSFITNFQRLSYLVLDEVDIISQEPFKLHVRVILEKAESNIRNGVCQKIFCGEKWNSGLETLKKLHLKSCSLVIGSYLEAVVYAKLRPIIYVVNRNHKANTVFDILKSKASENKILIACEDASDAIHLNEYLKERRMECVVAHEHELTTDIKDICTKWQGNKVYPVIVVTDDVLSELNIKNADILVHYGMTTKSKTNFFFRYSTILSHCLSSGGENQKCEKKTKAYDIILVDDDNHYQLPQVVDLSMRLGGDVSISIRQKCDEIRRQVELSKKSPICRNLLAFGNCKNINVCPQRHILLPSLDSAVHHPSKGWITFSIAKVHTASRFSVRLLEHLDVNGVKTKFDKISSIPERLKEFYRHDQNRRTHGFPAIGDICAVQSLDLKNEEIFCRAEIIEYTKLDKYDQPLEVRVRLIDDGDYMQLKIIKLLDLPVEFIELPPLAVEVRLSGVQPLDYDISWSGIATNFMKNLLTKNIEEHQCWFGQIVLALKNVLFLNPVMLRRFLPNLRTHVIDMVVQEKLVTGGHAVRGCHLPALLKLCQEAGIETPTSQGGNEKEVVVDEPQWAFFEKDFLQVEFMASKNTSVVFLRPLKYVSLLGELENDCRIEAEKGNKSKEELFKLLPGKFCLANFEDKWQRGKIESEVEKGFFIFFIDHGAFRLIEKKNVVPISQSLLMRLPCQAIECNLIGIRDDDGRSVKFMDEIHNFLGNGSSDLYACIVESNLKSEVTGGRKYSVNLVNRNGKSFNKYLLDVKLVSPIESESEFIGDVSMEMFKNDQNFTETEYTEVDEDVDAVDHNIENTSHVIDEYNGLEEYFSNLPQDRFDNENELLFLKEFASKIFPDKSLNVKDSSTKKNIPSDLDNESLKHPGKCDVYDQGSIIEIKFNFEYLMNFYVNIRNKKMEKPELKFNKDILTPKVLWTQSVSYLNLKILVSNVKRYSCQCSATNILFRCNVDGKSYAVDLKLFGGIIPNKTSISLKTFHVNVRLKKLCSPTWPRLHLDSNKHHWVNWDVETMCDQEYLLPSAIQLAKQNIEAGLLKTGIRLENIRPFSDSEDSDLDNMLLD